MSISVIGENSLTGGRIPEGSDVRFLCRADANPSNVTYRWYINEELVAGDYTTEMVSWLAQSENWIPQLNTSNKKMHKHELMLYGGKWVCNLKVNDPNVYQYSFVHLCRSSSSFECIYAVSMSESNRRTHEMCIRIQPRNILPWAMHFGKTQHMIVKWTAPVRLTNVPTSEWLQRKWPE